LAFGERSIVSETDHRTSAEDEQGGGIATAEPIATAESQDVAQREDVAEPEDVSDAPEDDEEGEEGEVPRRGRIRVSLRRLEEEGEVAADYLEELLDIVDLDGDIDIDVENGRASVAIVTESGSARELRALVGGQGEVLEALQELARLAVQAKTGERSRLMLDVAGYRASRRRALEDVAARAAAEVRRSGEPVRLEPMNAFERKVIHDAVAEAGLTSESEGVEPARRVVVLPGH
jgi:spoIIIJ-associated protein